MVLEDSVAVPAVSTRALWQNGDTLVVSLQVSGVPYLEAFGFRIESDYEVQLAHASCAGATVGFTNFSFSGFPSAALAGGYSLTGVDAHTSVEFLRLWLVPGRNQVIYIDGFVDDLDGAARLPIVWDGTPTPVIDAAPSSLALGQNHPNPFNPQTAIPYTLPNGSAPVHVRLSIHDVAGKVVRTLVDEAQAGGPREVVWDGRDDRGGPVSSGVYFYVLAAGGERRTRKLVLLK
jgi:hypothetical protein